MRAAKLIGRFFLLILAVSALAQQNGDISLQGDRLKIGFVQRGPILVNPLISTNEYDREINRFVYGDGLFTRADDGHVIHGLAASVSARPQQNRIWRVNLRSGIFFHDGSPITSSDVKFSFELYKKFAHEAAHLYEARLVRDVTILNEKTFSIELDQPLPDFTSTLGQLPIIPEKIYKQWMAFDKIIDLPQRIPVGAGHYIFRRISKNNELILDVNTRHYRNRANLDGIDFQFFQSYEEMIDAFLQEKIDMVLVQDKSIRQKIYQFTKARDHILSINRDNKKLYYINLNIRRAPFDDSAIRRVINYSINKKQIVKKILENTGHVAYNILDNQSVYFFEGAKSYSYNPLRSLQILHQAGFRRQPDGKLFNNKRELKFDFYFESGNPFQESIVRMISINLGELGVNVVPKPLNPELLEERIASGNYNAALQYYEYSPDQAATAVRDFYANRLRGSSRFTNFQQSNMENLYNFSKRSLNEDQLKSAIQQMQYQINQYVPCVYLFFEDRAYYAINNRFEHIKNLFYQKMEYVVKFYPKYEWYVPRNKRKY